MEDFNVTPTNFFALLELAFVLFVVALIFIVRSSLLANKVSVLQRKAGSKKQQPQVEAVSLEQYLRKEISRNQVLVDHAGESGVESEQQAASLLQLRGRFLELEVEVQDLADHPDGFREKLTTGISALREELQAQEEQSTVRTVQAELDSLKQIINNQQDVLGVLREKLKE